MEELKIRIEELYRRIDKNKDLLVAYNLIKKEKSKYIHIFFFPNIINRSMQSGNYKRAAKYYFFVNNLMADAEKNNKEIKKIITAYMLKD